MRFTIASCCQYLIKHRYDLAILFMALAAYFLIVAIITGRKVEVYDVTLTYMVKDTNGEPIKDAELWTKRHGIPEKLIAKSSASGLIWAAYGCYSTRPVPPLEVRIHKDGFLDFVDYRKWEYEPQEVVILVPLP